MSLQINNRGHWNVSLSEQQTANRMTAILTKTVKGSEVAHKILPRRNLAMAVSEVKQVYKPENKQMSYTTQLS